MSHFQRRRRQFGEPCDCLKPLIRIFGIMAAFVICGVGVDVYVHGYQAGLLILISSIIILFFEIKWVITLFLQLIFGNDNYSKCLRCWELSKYFGSWRLSLPYLTIGIALMLWPHNLWLSYVAGGLLILVAVLRLCLVFRFSNTISKDEGLLPQCDFENFTFVSFSRVDSGPDIAEEGFVEIGPSLDEDEALDDVC
uniref:Transmembrane protein 72 n=1 Tax=Musca domestica TaxID=7370 RepID=A0A1I8M816_MUSDO